MNGKAHTLTTLALATAEAATLTSPLFSKEVVLPIVAGTLLGIVITPDNDVDGGNIGYGLVRRLFKTDLLWAAFFKPYALGIKHRSTLSHGPLIGTVYSVVYLLAPITILIFKNQDVRWLTFLPRTLLAQLLALPILYVVVQVISAGYLEPLLYGFVGLLLAHLLHIFLDVVN